MNLGDEVGMVLSVNLGNSKVRVAKIRLNGNCQLTIEKETIHPVTDEVKSGTAEQLFGFVADCICEVEPENGIKVGFAFSFPCEQTSCRKGTLMEWTKGYSATGCIGKDPVLLLQNELVKRDVNVCIVALCNDSVSTLVAQSYKNTKVAMGVVLGSGTNAAYIERVSNIPKFHSEIAGSTMIINMEWGALGMSNRDVLPFSPLDEEIDRMSINPGKQYLEKMMGGLYLGETVRLWMLHLRRKDELLKHVSLTNRLFMEPMSFESEFCTTILLDDSDQYSEIGGILHSFGIRTSSINDRKVIAQIVNAVVTRSARLMGTCVYTVLNHMHESGLGGSIGVEGSVYKFLPGYKRRMMKALEELGMENVDCSIAEDASCRGTALIAYAVSPMYL